MMPPYTEQQRNYWSDLLVAGEKLGQLDVLAGNMLPKENFGPLPGGVSMGESLDPLFARASFPDGWRMRATEHHMWTDIVDREGRKRGELFYKASVYDRAAFVQWLDRPEIYVE